MSATNGPEWIARAPLLSRERFLDPHLGPGPVLDVGCVDERKPEHIATSFHAWLRARCPQLVGIDRDARAVEIARAHGFQVEQRDAACAELGGPYRMIFAGELIEHVGDPGTALRNLARHLAPGGCLLITTPNPFSIRQCLKILRHGRPQVHERHVAWFDPLTLSEAARQVGLEVASMAWIAPRRGVLSRFLCRLRRYWCEGFALELRPVPAGTERPGSPPPRRRDPPG